jgi:ribosome-associated translation inhibitor RaiA
MPENIEEVNEETHEENNVEDKILELGGNIELSGFKDLIPGSMTIIKKIVGTYVKRYSDLVQNFEKLHLHCKAIHKTTDEAKLFHIDAKVIYSGKVATSKTENRNIFTAIDDALKKIEAEFSK